MSIVVYSAQSVFFAFLILGSDWAGGMTITVESEGDGPPITTLTGILDQAALQGLLRRLYSLGLPLISVICVDCGR